MSSNGIHFFPFHVYRFAGFIDIGLVQTGVLRRLGLVMPEVWHRPDRVRIPSPWFNDAVHTHRLLDAIRSTRVNQETGILTRSGGCHTSGMTSPEPPEKPQSERDLYR